MKETIKINFADFWHLSTAEAIRLHNPLYSLLSKRFVLEISDDPDFLIYSCFGSKSGYEFLSYDCLRIFYTGENIRPDFTECDYAFSFDYPVTDRNYRLPLYGLDGQLGKLKGKKNIDQIIQKKTSFCNFVYSNAKAMERISFFHKLQGYKNVDSGGKVLNNIGYLVENKLQFIDNYKFTISFENESYPGYTSEKILHAFIANTIPIYWGNPLVGRDFNIKSFINCHDYDNFEEVVKRVIEIDSNDDLYRTYISEACFENGKDNEFINEENILARFEQIFSSKGIRRVARRTDFIKRAMYRLKFIAGNSI